MPQCALLCREMLGRNGQRRYHQLNGNRPVITDIVVIFGPTAGHVSSDVEARYFCAAGIEISEKFIGYEQVIQVRRPPRKRPA